MRPQGSATTSLDTLGSRPFLLCSVFKLPVVPHPGRLPRPSPWRPRGQEHRVWSPVPCLSSRPTPFSLGGLWGLGLPCQRGRCSARLLGPGPALPAVHCLRPAAHRLPTSRCFCAERAWRPCPDVPLPLCCPAAHSVLRQPDVPALVLAAPNEVQMPRGSYQRRGRPWEGSAGRGGAGGGMRWDGFPLECELGISLPK